LHARHARRSPSLLVADDFGSPARFGLHPDGEGGTDPHLTHEGVEGDAWHEVHAGWPNALSP